MNLSLEGKSAIICGSTGGIGLAIAHELAAMGANCILMARNQAALQETVPTLDISLNQLHGYLVADFSKPEEVKRVMHDYVSDHVVHILINNTGGPPAGPITEAKEEEFLNAFNQHLICNHIITRAVIPGMKKESYGRIINIISTSVKIPMNNLGVSNTIRGAVASWAKTMANELGAFNITVNNILPGLTKTNRLKTVINNSVSASGQSVEKVEAQMQKEIPAGRFADPEEIAAVAAFIASPAASYLNGVSLPVDGGKTGTI